MKNGRKAIPVSLRVAVFERDGYSCVKCGRGVEDGAKLEVDHIVQVADGGLTILENLRTLCFEDNRGRAALKLKQQGVMPFYKKRAQQSGGEELIGKKRRYGKTDEEWDEEMNKLFPGYKLTPTTCIFTEKSPGLFSRYGLKSFFVNPHLEGTVCDSLSLKDKTIRWVWDFKCYHKRKIRRWFSPWGNELDIHLERQERSP